MAFSDSQGNKFTNHSAMKSSEARLKAKGPAVTPKVDPASQNDGQDAGAQDGAAMAQQHGPAHMLEVHHMQGSHSVVAMHPDGHEHETQHGSAEEAHKYAADCAGCGMSTGGSVGEMQ